MGSSYENFHDPLGLISRMLRSRDRAAWFALKSAALRLLLFPLDLAWEAVERKRIRDAASSSLPILLIVGAPRSGTTLLYQTLTRFLPTSYFNNFSALFARAPITASVTFSRFNKQRRADYHSYYGNTAGWTAPNDGFHVWNRWLGIDRYSVPRQLSLETQRDMQRFFNAWFASFPQPFLNKNNRNTACVPLLAAALPNVYFIEVRREPAFVVQSLLQAREHIQGSKAIGWGLGSTSAASSMSMPDYTANVCAQVFHIDQMLRRDQALIAPERFISITYEDFCRAPGAIVQHVASASLGIVVDENRLQHELKPFETTNQVRLPAKEFDAIQRRLEQLYENHFTQTNSDANKIETLR
jgi:hypothetical protein